MKKTYKDPLHIPSARLVVMHKGKEAILLNKELLDKQNCWENLEEIKEMHQRKFEIYDNINETDNRLMLKEYNNILMDIEFKLQELWGFQKNANYHRFWEYPKRECPIMDNEDRYPNSCIISENCPLHGK